jgi:predicted transcriptional regulator of viral defense system
MNAQEYLNTLRREGRYSFVIDDLEKELNLSDVAARNAIRRLKINKLVVSPAKGFYLIVPPEYQAYGCLPADMFITDLMKHLQLPYYVGFLSAAQFYGAAHQKPQRFQVVTHKNRRPINCGRIFIEFIANKHVLQIPTKNFNTMTGTIAVVAPEALALDLIAAPQHAAGINNVVTILSELKENINPDKLIELNKAYPELFLMQRLGYLFELLGFKQIADKIAAFLINKKLHWAKLTPTKSYNALERNKKWKIIVNFKVETDL